MIRFLKLAVVAGLVGYLWLKFCRRPCPDCGSPFSHRVGEALPSRDGSRFRECLWCGKCWQVNA